MIFTGDYVATSSFNTSRFGIRVAIGYHAVPSLLAEMLKKFIAWFAVLCLGVTPLLAEPVRARHTGGRRQLPATVQRPLRLRNTCVAVCSIVNPTAHRPLGFARGSGFFVTPYHVLTCRHLLSVPSPTGLIPADRIIVEWVDGRQCDAVVVATEKYHDLALLQIDNCRWRGSPARLAETPLEIGDHIRIAGLFDPSGFWVAEGSVMALNVLDGFAMADSKVRSGFSGGPVFDREGKLQGLLSQRDDARNAIFVRADVLRNFLEVAGVLSLENEVKRFEVSPTPGEQATPKQSTGAKKKNTATAH